MNFDRTILPRALPSLPERGALVPRKVDPPVPAAEPQPRAPIPPHPVGPRHGSPVVGADVKPQPLIAEPTIVAHGDVMQYVTVISDLQTCLDRDARANLIYQNPGAARAEAQNLVNNAASLDGCTDYYFNCPKPDLKAIPPPTMQQLAAEENRKQAALRFAASDEMFKRAETRGLKNDAAGNAQVTAELTFYDDLSRLGRTIAATYTEVSSAKIASSSDWKKVQALDVEYQTLRARYEAFGFKASCALPSFPKAGAFDFGWIKTALVVAGIAAGAYAFNVVRGGAR